MGIPGMTSKPCHGCGKTGEGYRGGFRGTNEVCGECKSKLEFAEEQLKLLPRKATPHRVSWNSGGLPYIEHESRLNDEEIDVNRAVFELLGLVARNDIFGSKTSRLRSVLLKNKTVYDAEPVFDKDTRGFDQVVVMVTKREAEAFRKLHEQIRKLAKVAYASGYDHGVNMLNQLIRGEITNEQINEEAKNNRA
jgi:hypothetical protein